MLVGFDICKLNWKAQIPAQKYSGEADSQTKQCLVLSKSLIRFREI